MVHCLQLFAFFEKACQSIVSAPSILEQLVNFLHRDRLAVKLSLVHNAPRSSVYLTTDLQARWYARQRKLVNQLCELRHYPFTTARMTQVQERLLTEVNELRNFNLVRGLH